MITFFIVAALLLVGALLFVLPPLIGRRLRFGDVSHGQTNLSIYRDQLRELEADLANGTLDATQYETSKREIERRVLDEVEEDELQITGSGGPHWTLAAGIAIAIPLVAISMYLMLGTPVALDPAKVLAQSQEGPHDMSPQRLAKMVDGLLERLSGNPDDIEGWMMLAKTSQAIGRYADSVKAYREVVRRVPPDAQLLADFADTLAMANGRTLEGEPQQLIEQALKVDPKNVKALALGGTVAFQKQDFRTAAQLWRRILELVPPDAEFAQRMRESIIEAESRAGMKAAPLAQASKQGAEPRPAGSPVAGGGKLSGRVELDSAVAKSVAPGDTVFVFARAASGPKMPLAIVRLTAKDLPTTFELTEAMAMAPGMSIAKYPDLLVGARVSKSGNAMPQSGDWESELVPAKVGRADISLVISRFVR